MIMGKWLVCSAMVGSLLLVSSGRVASYSTRLGETRILGTRFGTRSGACMKLHAQALGQ